MSHPRMKTAKADVFYSISGTSIGISNADHTMMLAVEMDPEDWDKLSAFALEADHA